MTDIETLSEQYRAHWGLFDAEPSKHGSGRAVVCLTYPEIPPFASLSEAAEWACVDKSHLWRAIRDGRDAGGCRWAYGDGGRASNRGGRKGKPVVDDKGNRYPSARAAAKALGMQAGVICHCLNGRNKTAGGRRWFYAGEVAA